MNLRTPVGVGLVGRGEAYGQEGGDKVVRGQRGYRRTEINVTCYDCLWPVVVPTLARWVGGRRILRAAKHDIYACAGGELTTN